MITYITILHYIKGVSHILGACVETTSWIWLLTESKDAEYKCAGVCACA